MGQNEATVVAGSQVDHQMPVARIGRDRDELRQEHQDVLAGERSAVVTDETAMRVTGNPAADDNVPFLTFLGFHSCC